MNSLGIRDHSLTSSGELLPEYTVPAEEFRFILKIQHNFYLSSRECQSLPVNFHCSPSMIQELSASLELACAWANDPLRH